MVPEDTRDQLAIRDNIEAWAIWSDAGDWDRFRTCWHDDGYMFATWFQAPCAGFVKARREGWEKGVSILHFLGGTSIELVGNRAVAQTKMTIAQRAPVHGTPCDVVCTGRFYDLFEKRDDCWGMVLRQPIYEKDRLDPAITLPPSRSTPSFSGASPKATATSPTSKPRLDIRSRMICPASRAPRSRRFTDVGRRGSTARPSPGVRRRGVRPTNPRAVA